MSGAKVAVIVALAVGPALVLLGACERTADSGRKCWSENEIRALARDEARRERIAKAAYEGSRDK